MITGFGFSPADATRVLEDLKSRNIEIMISNDGPKWKVSFTTVIGEKFAPIEETITHVDANLVLAIRRCYESAIKKEWQNRET